MKRDAMSLLCGVLFGAGLAAAGMTDPRKVQAFLDLFGDWDPSLAFVMGSALAVTCVAFPLVLRRTSPLFDVKFHLPWKTEIDSRLVVGALLFGVGWGLYGYGPGPAIGALVYGHVETLLFVAALLAGVFAEWAWRRRSG